MTIRIFLMISVSFLLAGAGWADAVESKGGPENDIERIDTLHERGTEENYNVSGLSLLKASLELCLACMEEKPKEYEILWRCSRAAHQYAETCRNLLAEGWEMTCKDWGKRGMEIAEEAQGIEPDRVEGYFWQVPALGSTQMGRV